MTPVAAATAWKSFDVGRCDAGNLTAARQGLLQVAGHLGGRGQRCIPSLRLIQFCRNHDHKIGLSPTGWGRQPVYILVYHVARHERVPSHRRHVRALAFRIRTGDHSMNIRNASPNLLNEDLAPATRRQWGTFSIFNVWTSDVHSLWGYYLAASLFLLCGSFINFVLAIGLGSLLIFFLMNLVGFAGVKTGVPYPVLARASFGVWGANLPALVRAVVACFWYGAQTAAASGAIVALLTRTDALMEFHKTTHLLGHSGLEVICYFVVWALQLLIIQNGMETVRKFQDWAGPAVWVAMLILAVGLCVKAGGFSFDHGIPQAVLLEKTKDAGVSGEPGSFWALMAVGATWVTYFAALYLNFCDFSRYAKDKDAVRKGNLWGLPVNLILFSLVAGFTTIAPIK